MPAGDRDLATCEGVVDFHRDLLAMRSRFHVPADGDAGAVEHTASTVVDRDTVYLLQPEETDDGQGGWIAVDSTDGRLANTPVGVLLWLRGTVEETPAGPGPSGPIHVAVDLAEAVRRTPEPDRAGFVSALRHGRIGLDTSTVSGTVTLDDSGRVSRVRVTAPPGASPWFAVAYPADSMDLAMHAYGQPVSIPVPDERVRIPLATFVASIEVEDPGPSPWR
jgi:hypothetical protein